MNRDEREWEEKAGRLLRAGYGVEARPDAALRRQVWARLRQELRPVEAFPDAVLGGLGVILVLVAVGLGLLGVSSPLAGILWGWLIFNLALAPVAAVVILAVRKRSVSR
jgi:hypothetical protein